MSTNVVSAKNIRREKHVIDASGKVLGRLASEVAEILMGKNKAQFVPYLDTGDFVSIVNASKIRLTGKKLQNKNYYRHSGYPGGLRVEKMGDLLERRPEYVVEHAIKGMLPNTKLGKQMIKKLKVFGGEETK